MGAIFVLICSVAGLSVGCAGARPTSGRHHAPPEAPAPAPSAAHVPEAWATAEQSTVPYVMLQSYVPDAVQPIKERGCPFAGTEVPVCARRESEPVGLEKVGKLIRIRGRLVTFGDSCTQAHCPDNGPYCNRFQGTASIETSGERVMLEGPWPLEQETSRFRCVGDRSAQCCGFSAMGEEVIAQGMLHSAHYADDAGTQHQLWLRSGQICRVGPAGQRPTNLYVTDLPSTIACN